MNPQKMANLSLLLDFYGALLTEHQYKILFLWCNQDFSFGEIAKTSRLSRQAVYDILKNGQKKLYSYEDRLHLVNDRKITKKDIKKLWNKILSFKDKLGEIKLKEIEKIVKRIEENV